MSAKPKFCMFCNRTLVFRYPGNDPENGPAMPRCPDHGGPEDWFQDRLMEEEQDLYAEFLEKIAEGYRSDPDEPKVPPYVQFAAEIIQAHRHMRGLVCDRYRYQYQKETWETAPWFGNSVDDCPPTRRQTYNHLIRRK